MNSVVIGCAFGLSYLAAGRAKWRLFCMKAQTAEERDVILASRYGRLKMRAGAAIMVLTWPVWDELLGAILFIARKLQARDEAPSWEDADDVLRLQPVATETINVRARQKRA